MRRRVDLRHLSAPARYGVALAVLAAVIGIVLLVRPDAGIGRPATWYTVAVKIGAVALLAYLAGRLLWRIQRKMRRPPPDHH